MDMHPNDSVRVAWFEVSKAVRSGEDTARAWLEFERAWVKANVLPSGVTR